MLATPRSNRGSGGAGGRALALAGLPFSGSAVSRGPAQRRLRQEERQHEGDWASRNGPIRSSADALAVGHATGLLVRGHEAVGVGARAGAARRQQTNGGQSQSHSQDRPPTARLDGASVNRVFVTTSFLPFVRRGLNGTVWALDIAAPQVSRR
jgi:hypothetical protein